MHVGYVKIAFYDWSSSLVSDALPPKICVHLPRWSASTTVRWQKNTRTCHQHLTMMLVEI